MHHLPRRLRKALQYAVGILLFIVVWWGGSMAVGRSVWPPPGDVLAYLVEPGVILDFLVHASRTFARGAVGFGIAWIFALPIGFLMGRHEAGERIGFFPLFLLQGAPPLFWITPLILWLGTDGLVVPAVVTLVVLPLLIAHTASAIKHIPGYEYDVFTVYAPRAGVVARELYLPHLLPAIRSNAHLALLVAVKAAMLAEWFAAQDGFGRKINVFYQFFAMKEFMGWALLFLLLVGGISYALHQLLEWLLPAYRSTAVPVRTGEPIPDRTAKGGSLTARHLSFGYEMEPLFQDLNLTVTPGRPLALYGRSGCGKTTLLKCAAGILKPWAGTVEAPGRVGLVFQEDALLGHRDALGNVLLPAFPKVSEADVQTARRCLNLWGLSGCEGKYPHQLSGGMRKRLAMARAWFLRPSVLLLDEPFVNLDREARLTLWELFFERTRDSEITTLIVTHYPEELSGHDVQVCSWEELGGGPEATRQVSGFADT